MKKIQIWFWLILKRLIKNPIFVLTLLLIPALVLGIRFSAGAGTSMLKVAIYVPKGDSVGREYRQDSPSAFHPQGQRWTGPWGLG